MFGGLKTNQVKRVERNWRRERRSTAFAGETAAKPEAGVKVASMCWNMALLSRAAMIAINDDCGEKPSPSRFNEVFGTVCSERNTSPSRAMLLSALCRGVC